MFPSKKNSSRRRRRTFGNEDRDAGSTTECRRAASDGTRSSISGFRLISASSRTLPAQCCQADASPAWLGQNRPAGGGLCPPDTGSGVRVKLRMNASSKTSGRARDFPSPGPAATAPAPRGERWKFFSAFANLCYYRPLGDMAGRRDASGDPTMGWGLVFTEGVDWYVGRQGFGFLIRNLLVNIAG